MIAPATHPAATIAAMPPPTASAKARPSRPAMPARQIAPRAVDRERHEDEREHDSPDASSGICEASRT